MPEYAPKKNQYQPGLVSQAAEVLPPQPLTGQTDSSAGHSISRMSILPLSQGKDVSAFAAGAEPTFAPAPTRVSRSLQGILQRMEGDHWNGTVKTGDLPTGEQDDVEMDIYEKRKHIEKLHARERFEIEPEEAAEEAAESLADSTVVGFTEGKPAKSGLPMAIDIAALGLYGNKKEPENEGQFEGTLILFAGAFKIVPKKRGRAQIESHRTPDGRYDFAVMGDINDDLVRVSRKGHYSMTSGKSALYAGEVRFSAGVVTGWNNKSGHYEPLARDAPRAPFPLEKFEGWSEAKAESKEEQVEEGADEEKSEERPAARRITNEDRLTFLREYWAENKNFLHKTVALKAAKTAGKELFEGVSAKTIENLARANNIPVPYGVPAPAPAPASASSSSADSS